MFNFGTFNASNVSREYRQDPVTFVTNVIEGLGDGVFNPHEFSLRELAAGIMGFGWLEANCPTPPGSSMNAMWPNRKGITESYVPESYTDFDRNGEGGVFATRTAPQGAAVMPWKGCNGRVNKSLLESYKETMRKGMTRSSLLENDAVKHSHFMNIVGQIYFNEVLKHYKNEDYTKFQRKIETRQSDILDSMEKMANTTTIGANVFGDVVKEGDPYQPVGLTENYIHVGPKAKRGRVLKITKEAIKGNKTGDLLESAQTLGIGLAQSVENRVIDAIIDENGGAKSAVLGGHRYHWRDTSYATFQASTPWANLKASNGLSDYSNIEAAWLQFMALTDPYTGEPIEIMPKELIVTPTNYVTAQRLLRASQVRVGDITSGDGLQTHSPNPIQGILGDLEVLSSRRLAARAATDTDWWLGNVREAVRRYVIWDVTPESYGAGTQQEIFNDVVQIIKISLMDIVSVVEPRALQENNA